MKFCFNFLFFLPVLFIHFSLFAQSTFQVVSKAGHQAFAVAFNSDNKIMASGGNDSQVIFWDIKNGTQLNTLRGHSDWVVSLAFSDDGKYLVSGSKDKSARIWTVKGATMMQTLSGHENTISSVAISPDSRYVATGSYDYTVRIWDLSNGSTLRTLSGHSKEVTGICFSPDGKTLASVSGDKSLKIWDINTGRVLQSVDKAHNGWARAVRFSPNGKQIATAGDDKTVKIWDATSLRETGAMYGHRGWVQSLSYSADSKYLASGGHDKEVYVWEVAKKEEVMNMRADGFVYSLAFSPNGKFLSYADLTSEIAILDVNSLGIQSAEAIYVNNTDNKNTNTSDLNIDLGAMPTNFLLVIGIDKYKHWPSLSNAVKDAQDVKKLLQYKYTFESYNTIEIYNEKATEDNIYKAFQDLKGKVKPNDNLLIYYSGHGYYDATYKEGYWVTTDAEKGKISDYFSNTTLLKFIGAIDTKHTFVVADACFSGALFGKKRGYIENVEAVRSRWALTSGGLEFVADGNKGTNSPFATYFMKFLQVNTEKKLPCSKLVEYVKQTVANNSTQQPEGDPLKDVGDEGGEFIFYLRKK